MASYPHQPQHPPSYQQHQQQQQYFPYTSSPASPGRGFAPIPIPPPQAYHPNTSGKPDPQPQPQPYCTEQGMIYRAPLAQIDPPPNVFLGYVHEGTRQKPVYGPPGSDFDWRGNVYFDLGNGRKEFVGNVVGYDGTVRPAAYWNKRQQDERCGLC